MSAADFKAGCLELMDTVERTGRSVVVTKQGGPVDVVWDAEQWSSSIRT